MIAASFVGLSQGEKARKLKTLAARQRAMERIDQIYARKINELAKRYAEGKITIGDWQLEMRTLLRRNYTLQLVAGAGNDKKEIDPRDYLKLGTQLQQQYRYLEDFTTYIQDKAPSLGYIQARARMYSASAHQVFWQQISGVELPAYPGDGSTRCITNCKCSWELRYIRDRAGRVIAIEAYWRLGKAEHCEDCVKRADTWKPIRILAENARISTAFKELGVLRVG